MTSRLSNAISKLYAAFYAETLNPECCKQCAVGNIMDNLDSWKHLTDTHGSLNLNYVGMVHERLGRKFNGYKPSELLKTEAVFLKALGYSLPLRRHSRPAFPITNEQLFEALSETVTFLCKLDGINDVMDYSKVFQPKTKASKPTLQLA